MKHAMPSIALICGLCAAHPSFAAPLDASTQWQDVAPTATVSSVVGQFAVADDAIAAAANATLQAAKDYADGAISAAGSVTPEMVTNIVEGVAPVPGNYAAVSNAAMNAAVTNALQDAALAGKRGMSDMRVPGAPYVVYDEGTTDSPIGDMYIDGEKCSYVGLGQWVEPRGGLQIDALGSSEVGVYFLIVSNHDPSAIGFTLSAANGYTATVLGHTITGYIDTLAKESQISDVHAVASAAATTNALQDAALADIAATVGTNTADIATIGSQVNAVGSYLNAEDAKFVSEHYDSSTRMPEAHVEVRLEDHGTNAWITIWNEMTRWGAFVGDAFDWNTWNGLHAWMTNVTAELSFKADRAWGAYDSETGGYSPEGYTQISSSNILIAAGMAYQRTVTTAGSVWILQCNTGVAHLGGDTNGFFRVMDSEGNVHFEIIKGDRRELGCDASGITVGANNVMTIPYSVDADAYPTIQCTASLNSPSWKSEDDPDCLCTVSWSGVSGAYVATVTPKTAQASMFVRATYLAGAETRIRNTAPMSVEGGILCTDGIHKCKAVYNNGTIIWEVVP